MNTRYFIKRLFCLTGLAAIGLLAIPAALQAQHETATAPVDPAEIKELEAKIVASPDSLSYHKEYIKAVGLKNPALTAQYEKWMQQFPGNSNIPFGLATAMYNSELPEATPWLKKSVELNPKLAEAYQMLSIDAERWGNETAAREYMGKANAAAPENPSYAFYYAMDFEHTDPAMWRKKLYELAKKFPAHERGAQGLFWLATRSTDQKEKVKVYELLRKRYPPAKFNWSQSGMNGLYELYLQKSAAKASTLAKSLGKENGWPAKDTLAQKIGQVQKLIAAKKFAAAEPIAGSIRLSRYSASIDMVALLKASIADGLGNTRGAYDSLLALFAKKPGDELFEGIKKYGSKLGRSVTQIEEETAQLRNAASKPAPAFNLGLYTSDKTVSLDDYKGKVILLTFWFPGCGPCRGEFPHFEKVLKKFQGQEVVYLAINGIPEQDGYVVPFVNGTKYTFTPLRTEKDWSEKTYGVRGYPTNFLIDKQGKIIFTNFMIHDERNERMLELMISSLLARS